MLKTIIRESLKPCTDFSQLIDPISVDDFRENYWEQKPFLIKGKAEFFSELFQWQDVDNIFLDHTFRAKDIRVAKRGALVPEAKYIDSKGCIDPVAIAKLYQNDHTVVFEHLDKHHAKLRLFANEIESKLKLRSRTNVYVSPASSTGFNPHYDPHCVMIMQIAGSKEWCLYENSEVLPIDGHQKPLDSTIKPFATFMLEPGDVLYLPRGCIHAPRTIDKKSLHVTIGFKSYKYYEMLELLTQDIVQNSSYFRKGIAFDRSFDETEFKRQVIDFIKASDLAYYRDVIERKYLIKKQATVEQLFSHVEKVNSINLSSVLTINKSVSYQMVSDENKLKLTFDKCSLELPSVLKGAVEFIINTDLFSVSDIPYLNEEEQLALSKKLCQTNFIKIKD